MSTTLLLLFILSAWTVCSLPTISAYLSNGTYIGPVARYTYNSNAAWYIVGNSSNQILFWQPFDVTFGGGNVAAAMLHHIQDYIDSVDGAISVKVFQADWSGVVGTPICSDPGATDCPDLILIGTTQVASRVAEGHVLDLSNFLSSYAGETGTVLNDDFNKYCFYDYYINGAWHALPFIADFRIVGFNKTTFDLLGLEYPPPWGNWPQPWGKSWSWPVFADYAQNISRSTGKDGYQFHGCWDEEIKISMMAAQNFGARLMDGNECALRDGGRFEAAMRESVYRIFVEDKSGNIDIVPLDDTFYSWLDEPAADDDPLNEPGFCCQCALTSINGMDIESPASFLGFQLWIPGYSNGTIGLGLAPGQLSFLGGSGLIITAESNKSSEVWDLLMYLIDPTNPESCLQDVATATGAIPPYDSALELPKWNTPQSYVSRLQIAHAAPEQYPLTTFSQFGQIEGAHPLRLLWLNLIHKNMSFNESIDRACEVFDYIFQPGCTVDDWTFNVSDCALNSTRIITFFWKQPQVCRGGVSLSLPITLDSCPYVPWGSSAGVGLTIVTTILMLLAVGLGVCFVVLKDTKIIKLANVPFSLLVIIGGLLTYGSVLASLGDSVLSCVLPAWILSLGFILVFGSFNLKMYRLWKIFNNKTLVAFTIKDEELFSMFGIIFIIDVALLLLWTFLPPNIYSSTTQLVDYSGLYVTEFYCSRGNSVAIALLFVFKGIIFVFGCYFSFALRNAPSDFKDREFVTVSISVLGFAAVVLIPVAFLLNRALSFLLVSLGILVVTSFALGMYAIPKILHGFGILELGEEMENFFNRKNLGMKCPTCKKPLGTTDTKRSTHNASKGDSVVVNAGSGGGTE